MKFKTDSGELWLGDCLELMKEIPDGSVDLVLTDPPYGMNYVSNYRKVQYEKIENDTEIFWLDRFVDECHRVLSDNTSIYMFCSWHKIDIFKQSIERKFNLKNIIVWVKNNHGSGDLEGSYAPKHEFVIFAHKGRSKFRGKRIPDVMNFPRVDGNKSVHPTEKNVDMLKLFVKNSSNKRQTVIDPFMGSGTTGIACKVLERQFIGIELNETYFNISKKRFEETNLLTSFF